MVRLNCVEVIGYYFSRCLPSLMAAAPVVLPSASDSAVSLSLKAASMRTTARPSMANLLSPDMLKDLRDWESVNFESELVRALCSRYRIGRRARLKLLGESQSESFHEQYRLAAIDKCLPSFPLKLFAKSFPNVARENRLHKLLADFENRPFVKEFRKLQASVELDGRPCGLVVPCPLIDMSRGGMSAIVVHDWDGPLRIGPTFISVLEPRDNQPVKPTFVDTLPLLLDAIDESIAGAAAHQWRVFEQ